MKKQHSKSTLTKKTKVPVVQQTRKNRVGKTQSCIKINSQHSEQSRAMQHHQSRTINASQLSKHNHSKYVHYDAVHTTQTQVIERPLSNRHQPQANKVSIDTTNPHRDEPCCTHRDQLQKITKQNASLRQKCCQLEEVGVRDKEKIKNLIIRLNQIKQYSRQGTASKPSEPPASSTKPLQSRWTHSASAGVIRNRQSTPLKQLQSQQGLCANHECQQRRRYLQDELYKQRLARDKLEKEGKEWQRDRAQLRQQYSALMVQFQEFRGENGF